MARQQAEPLTAAAELRELIRQAHEASKDARADLRELRQERAAAAAAIAGECDRAAREMAAVAHDAVSQVQQVAASAAEQLSSLVAHCTPEQFSRLVVESCRLAILEDLDEARLQMLAGMADVANELGRLIAGKPNPATQKQMASLLSSALTFNPSERLNSASAARIAAVATEPLVGNRQEPGGASGVKGG